MKHKHALFPFIMGLLAFICFLFVLLAMAGSVQPLWGRTAVLLLPSVILSGTGILAWKGVLSSGKTVALTAILTVVLLAASVFYVFLLSLWSVTTQTTDVKYYSRAYAQIEGEDGTEGIFPSDLPDDAKDVTFLYQPQFLQGGEVFELSYSTTDERISQWEELLEGSAEWIGSNEAWYKMNNWGFFGADSTRYHLYWDGGFNHGEMSYVLIDPATDRITFYYSDW